MGRRTKRAGQVVAIDGPAASGKSSAAQEVAGRLGFAHVNSGLLYRAVAWWALRKGIGDDPKLLGEALRATPFDLATERGSLVPRVDGALPGAELQSPEVTARVSAIAKLPAVRDVVLRILRTTAVSRGTVCDGRDIATTVFPDAGLKVFLVADSKERARRRLLERGTLPTPRGIAEEAKRLEERDRTDSSRDLSPLKRADDAVVIDTTAMRPSEVVDAIVALAVQRQSCD